MSKPAPLVLSVFATFAVGGPQVRFAALANHYGRAWRHAVIAMDGRYDCAERLSPNLDITFPGVAISRRTLTNVAVFRRALAELAPDVLVTNNWGSIDWAVANLTRVGGVRHVHIEDGFGPDEAAKQFRRRVLWRRMMLQRSTIVLPSLTLNKIAAEIWRLPPARLHYIPNGLDLHRFRPVTELQARARANAGRPPLIGTCAALRPEKNLSRLLHAARILREEGVPFRLAIIGGGTERPKLETLTTELGLTDVVAFEGALEDPSEAYRALDVFALSSDTEQMPLSVLEAMATGLPAAATMVGDVPQMLAAENRPYLAEKDPAALAAALRPLLRDAALRRTVGAANRRKAERDYDAQLMFRRYSELLAPPAAA